MKPRSIAVVGASEREGSFGRTCAVNSVKSHGISDHVYYVNPNKKEELMGRKVYKSLGDLPETVDCAIICTPREATLGVINEAAALGTKAAVIFASGFSEEGTEEGIRLENEMLSTARKHGMSILGPNCAGMVNNIDKVDLWGMGSLFDMNTRGKGIGIIAQSGFIAANIMADPVYNISYGISSGNGNITQLEDFFDYMVEDDEVRVLAVYLEGIKNARKFVESLKKAAMKHKPVVVLKAGKSRIGVAAAASHTGNLAGSNKAYEAIFRKFGVMEVSCLEELMCAAQMFSVLDGNFPATTGFAGINMSGGENTICADLFEAFGIYLPALDDDTKQEIRKFIPSFATPNNPLDPTTELFGDKENFIGLVEVFERLPRFGGIVIGGNVSFSATRVTRKTCEFLAEARQRGVRKPIFMVPPFEATRDPYCRELLESNGVVLTSSTKTAYYCLRLLADFVDYDYGSILPQSACHSEVMNFDGARALTEFASKKSLLDFGIPMPPAVIARSADDVSAACSNIGFPMVMKISSVDIMHKTDAGGVKLNIADEASALKAFGEIMESCRRYKPDADIEGVLISRMAKPGTEFIIGVSNDAQFGPMLLTGMGGVFVEIFGDVALSPCPVNEHEAAEMLKSLKSWKMLTGYRGSAPLDVDALVDLMVKVSNYAVANAERVKELDINPVFVYEKGRGVAVVDALIVEKSDHY
jgi:acyl-CoA synthetase (NDP forming)